MSQERLGATDGPAAVSRSPMSHAGLPPATVEAEGRLWHFGRAWPGGEGRIGVELVPAAPSADTAGSSSRGVRAGWFDGREVTLLPPGTDRRLPDLESIAAEGEVVSHRPGKRAVVRRRERPEETVSRRRRRSGPSSSAPEMFTKVVRPGRAEAILSGIARAGAFAGPFRTPAVLDAGEAHVSFSAVTGTSMHSASSFTAEAWDSAWTQVLAAWETAIQDPSGSPGDIPVHDAAAETEVLRHWAGQAGPYLRAASPAALEDAVGPEASVELLAEAVEQTAAALLELPARRLVPAHRDLHDKQLLFSAEQGPALLDVDTAALADPALDLANLRAHAGWRVRQGVWTADQAETVRRVINDAAYRTGISFDALNLYERATLLRVGCVYAFRPAYAGAAAQLRTELIAETL